jgi:hypothetical protein
VWYICHIHGTTFIYALLDPRNGTIRYVGKANDPAFRLTHHLSYAHRGGSHKNYWVLSLLRVGQKPLLEVLDEVPSGMWQEYERSYIAVFRALGFKLLNTLPGGNGYGSGADHPRFGKSLSDAAKAKLSVAHTGKRVSQETRAKISASTKGITKSDAVRANMSAGQTGRTQTAETRRKLSIVNSGKTMPSVTRLKISASLKATLAKLNNPSGG